MHLVLLLCLLGPSSTIHAFYVGGKSIQSIKTKLKDIYQEFEHKLYFPCILNLDVVTFCPCRLGYVCLLPNG